MVVLLSLRGNAELNPLNNKLAPPVPAFYRCLRLPAHGSFLLVVVGVVVAAVVVCCGGGARIIRP